MGRVPQPTPDVVAHRGASAHRAEHTRAAYELALEQGADALECDIRVSRDGHLVCVHDRRIDRTSSGRGVVSELTVAAMSALDFGGWHREFPESADDLLRPPPDNSEHGVLTLDELLGLVRDTARDVRLFIETKHPVRYGGLVEHKLVALLARHGLAAPVDREKSQVLMMSFSQSAVRRFRKAAPRIPTVLLFDRFRSGWRSGELPPWADLAGPDIRLLRRDPDFVARAAASGRDTYCWTVDDPADVALCHRAGVRFVATNSPAATRVHLAESGNGQFGSVTVK
ncbi:putative glycerophosphoryl diester phosphodiesterase [Saccharopolyspora subtropica]|uniref:Glycerophosphodiester phosphodiesterase n=1 Tax=Saccharopolyspora thermophila TaxID=89367 RepID=A0A917JSN7_9PSEU|nr:glycerophosphodiester phosphodiesterase family protein [Saccharopolyspora subtropica]GGI81925.1 putative glycerophosphoryl diester phosphodiesterase [Saccharopolyspora subtropica]